MSNPLISVIVPVYKVEKYLPNCIESVQRQSYFKWELILVDDGSPDGCPRICDEYASHDDRIKVIHKENGGLSSARNAGLEIFKGDYITFLDSDDFWHQDFLETLMAICVDNNADIAQCGFVRGEESIFPSNTISPNIKVYDNHTIFTKCATKIVVWAKLYKRYILEGVNMPEGLINEDDWTTWKLYYKAKKIAVTNIPLYYYTVNPASIMGQSKRKPDFSYLDAYKERIGFFVDKKEEDMEHCSRMQLCKAMVLSYGNPYLSQEERQMVKTRFEESYQIISRSKFLPKSIMLVFWMFHHFPKLASKLAEKK